MKNIFVLTLIALFFSNCDPVSDMEADIENLTDQTLTVQFYSSDESLSKTLQIQPNEIVLFQEGFDIGSTYLEPSLVDYDSVLITNQAQQILKVFKANEAGKNIYNVDEYWLASKPSKSFFNYKFQIESVDIE